MAIRSVDLGVQQASAQLAPKPDPSVTHKKALVVVESLSRVRLFATPWTTARQASLSITNSRSLLRLVSIESVMPSNHLILCRPLLLPPSIFPSIKVFSTESSGDLCAGKAQDPPEDALGSPSPRSWLLDRKPHATESPSESWVSSEITHAPSPMPIQSFRVTQAYSPPPGTHLYHVICQLLHTKKYILRGGERYRDTSARVCTDPTSL